MALARWKDLCVDAADPERMARFWAGLLGLRTHRLDDGDVRLTGASDEQAVWVNAVPEPRTVKQRVHLDVHAGSVEEVEALGAVRRSAPGQFPWTVLADPEGGELCVFVRDQVPVYRLYELCVDCGGDHAGIAGWWADVLGGRAVESDRGFSYVDRVPGLPFEAIAFLPVPEPKTVKNRIHWDVVAPAVRPLLDAGAVVPREPDDDTHWHVLADPDGNEFCAFAGE